MSDDPKNEAIREVRQLLRSRVSGALATSLPGKQATGSQGDAAWPFASLITYALDDTMAPLLLLSGLSDHTKALQADGRCTLLVEATAGFENPQAGPRAGLLCIAAPQPEPRAREQYLARHPAAAMYAGLTDFKIWRLAPQRIHSVGGFGRARWLEWNEVAVETPEALRAAQSGIVTHMNEDHGSAIDLYANKLLHRTGTGWKMTGIDADGCDLRLGGEVARFDFPARISDAQEARKALVEAAARARAA